MEAGLDSLKFSFNFSDPQQFHDVTRVRAGDFWTVERNLREARRVRDEVEAATGHRCGLYASSIRYDDAQHERMAAAWRASPLTWTSITGCRSTARPASPAARTAPCPPPATRDASAR
jgi:hypothetical protein